MADDRNQLPAGGDEPVPSRLEGATRFVEHADAATGRTLELGGAGTRCVTNNLARMTGQTWRTFRDAVESFRDASAPDRRARGEGHTLDA